MPRGGPRPGAGAPTGNTNALKTGLYSQRLQLATLILAATPELQALLRHLQRHPHAHPTYRRALRDAYRTLLADPALAASIRNLVRNRLTQALDQIQNPEAPAITLRNQSDNQS